MGALTAGPPGDGEKSDCMGAAPRDDFQWKADVNVLDLFSGIGGFSLGLERAGMRTAAFCEIDPYCQRVLAKHWPNVPIHEDIRRLDGAQYAGAVDVVCGGYPCQPFSVAGKQLGED